jgi:UDP-N-acetylglucosamine--N-acetylmuramyl-(pentapeptide) pyrophosphoryl-undecaprenol N-acetylglucosamine transferase
MEKFKKILVTGGGSGGHVSVASAIIEEVKEKDPLAYANLIYVGGDLGMVGEDYGNSLEQRKFKNVDFKTVYIRAGKLQRHLSISSIKLLLRTVLGFFGSLKIIRKEKPDLIFSSGGFVSVPICIAGWLKGVPIYLHEQTAKVGLSNRIVGNFAKRIYIAFESSRKYFDIKKTKLVGNIVRDAVTDYKLDEVSQDIRDIVTANTLTPLIYVSGGGLGSHIINQKILSEINSLLLKYRVILQTGDNKKYKDYQEALKVKNKLPVESQERFLPIKFINDKNIGYVYHNIDLFLGRAGANTVYEIAILAKPSIFIPIPWVTNNEQYENAKTLENTGISKIIDEKIFKSINLKTEIDKHIEKSSKIDVDIDKLQRNFPTDAVEKVFNDLYT